MRIFSLDYYNLISLKEGKKHFFEAMETGGDIFSH